MISVATVSPAQRRHELGACFQLAAALPVEEATDEELSWWPNVTRGERKAALEAECVRRGLTPIRRVADYPEGTP